MGNTVVIDAVNAAIVEYSNAIDEINKKNSKISTIKQWLGHKNMVRGLCYYFCKNNDEIVVDICDFLNLPIDLYLFAEPYEATTTDALIERLTYRLDYMKEQLEFYNTTIKNETIENGVC